MTPDTNGSEMGTTPSYNVTSPKGQPLIARLREGLAWRYGFLVKPAIKRMLRVPEQQWGRVVSDRATTDFIRSLKYDEMDVVEISSTSEIWSRFGFRSHLSTRYPEFDLCERPLKQEAFDIVLAEQVLEHVDWPFRAARNVYEMLRPGGWFVVSTPFLIRIHAYPYDSTRWTTRGLKNLLVEAGFSPERIVTGAWGNRACVKANFSRFPSWIPWWHSLKNEDLYPVTVWAFAQKPPKSSDQVR